MSLKIKSITLIQHFTAQALRLRWFTLLAETVLNLFVKVTDEDNVAIEGVDVDVVSDSGQTNVDGDLTLYAVPGQENTVTASHNDYVTQQIILPVENAYPQQLNIQMIRSRLELKVVNRLNEPIEGATCRVLNAVGGSNNVLGFDGVDDYVSSAKMTPAGSYTVMMWVKLNSLKALNIGEWFANQRGNTTTGQDWQIIRFTGSAHGSFRAYNSTGGTNVIPFGPTNNNLPTEQWFHMAAQFDVPNSKLRTFFNGTQYEEATLAGTPNSNSPNLVLSGRGWQTNTSNIDGNISDFRVYNAALSEANIQTAMAERSEPSANLTNYWKMDEGTGTALTDSTGLVTGTIYGATWQEADESFPLYDDSIQGYDPTPYDIQTTNANGLCALNYQINNIHGLEVTLPGKRRFIMPFERTTRGLLDWQVMLSDYLATFATDRGNILINSEPENNDSNFLIE